MNGITIDHPQYFHASRKTTNHFIVFQNYWLWKKNIKDNEIICIIRLFNSKGQAPINIKEFKINKHNNIDLNKEFNIYFSESNQTKILIHLKLILSQQEILAFRFQV